MQELSPIVQQEMARINKRIDLASRRIVKHSRETEELPETTVDEDDTKDKNKKKAKRRVVSAQDKAAIVHEQEVFDRLTKVVDQMKKTNTLVYDQK